MSRSQGQIGRLQRGDGPAVDGRDPHKDWRPDAPELAEILNSLTPSKQAQVLELWPAVESETDEGLTITARSKKELARLRRANDPVMLEWFRTFEPGDVFYDIGANCGALTLAAAGMHGDRIRIVSMEPSFSNFESLVRNLSSNDFLSFTVPLQLALLDHTGLEPMNYTSIRSGTALHAVGEPVDYEGQAFTPVETQMVPTYALDDLIDSMGLPAPTRVKIDVDGYEESVLRGAQATLRQGTVMDLAVEVVDHDRAGTRLAAIRDLMGSHGYELAQTNQHHGEGSFVADCLFRRAS